MDYPYLCWFGLISQTSQMQSVLRQLLTEVGFISPNFLLKTDSFDRLQRIAWNSLLSYSSLWRSLLWVVWFHRATSGNWSRNSVSSEMALSCGRSPLVRNLKPEALNLATSLQSTNYTYLWDTWALPKFQRPRSHSLYTPRSYHHSLLSSCYHLRCIYIDFPKYN